MRARLIATVLAVLVVFPGGPRADDDGARVDEYWSALENYLEDGAVLAEEGWHRLLDGMGRLERRLETLPRYGWPERRPNGDIIIPRRPPSGFESDADDVSEI